MRLLALQHMHPSQGLGSADDRELSPLQRMVTIQPLQSCVRLQNLAHLTIMPSMGTTFSSLDLHIPELGGHAAGTSLGLAVRKQGRPCLILRATAESVGGRSACEPPSTCKLQISASCIKDTMLSCLV